MVIVNGWCVGGDGESRELHEYSSAMAAAAINPSLNTGKGIPDASVIVHKSIAPGKSALRNRLGLGSLHEREPISTALVSEQ